MGNDARIVVVVGLRKGGGLQLGKQVGVGIFLGKKRGSWVRAFLCVSSGWTGRVFLQGHVVGWVSHGCNTKEAYIAT